MSIGANGQSGGNAFSTPGLGGLGGAAGAGSGAGGAGGNGAQGVGSNFTVGSPGGGPLGGVAFADPGLEGAGGGGGGAGSGGAGGSASDAAMFGGGGGGGGGAGLVGTGTLSNTTNRTGGNGANGGNSAGFSSLYSGGGGGGGGGSGVLFQGTEFTNTATLQGGNGGNGGTGSGSNYFQAIDDGGGGAGGHGIHVTTTGGASVTNFGTIQGGLGGQAGSGSWASGGSGVYGEDLTVINAGLIAGGLTNGVLRADAITFTGGTNILEVRSGATFTGNVVADSTASTDDILRLGGTVGATFAIGQVGAAAQFRSFEIFEVAGSGTWTLSGTAAAAITTRITGTGTLVVNGGSNLHDSAAVEVSGGTLELGANETIGTLDGASGSIDLGGFTLTVTGTTLDAGALVLAGGGTFATSNTTGTDFTGTASADSIAGYTGGDTVTAGDGADTLDGGAGADSLLGGDGDDVFRVDDAGDVVTEASGEGTDRVLASVTYTLAAEVEQLELLGGSAIDGTGNGLANLLIGNGAANLLSGLGGNDTLYGGSGNDTLAGGTGDDVFHLEDAGDTVLENSGGGYDRVRALVSHTLAANVEQLVLLGGSAIDGTGNDLANGLVGNGAANLLSGLGGNDTLFGGAGSDTLSGGNGVDVLAGGAGADVFRLAAAAGMAHYDVLFDFSVVDDSIELDQTAFAALSPGALAAGAFATGPLAAEADDRVLYWSETGLLFYDADGVGGTAGSLLIARLGIGLALTAADFSVIA